MEMSTESRTDDVKKAPHSIKKHTGDELLEYYRESESMDKHLFAEMRSNILLIAGEHYYKPTNKFLQTIRNHEALSKEQKIRLTKNHVQKVIEIYKTHIMGASPGVGIEPRHPKELKSVKQAEMHSAVWKDSAERQEYDSFVEDSVDDFLGIGECWAKVFFDPSKGPTYGYHQATDEEGNEQIDEMGQPVPDMARPVPRGEVVFELHHGFNVLIAPNARSPKSSPYIGIRKMSKVDDLVKQFNIVNDEAIKKIQEVRDETFVIFDAHKGEYTQSAKGQTMVVEWYFRPCARYQRGWYYICVGDVILDDGELPEGEFPIIGETCKKIQTSGRGRSPVKQMRPYQVEINRAASKMAEHQITWGDDKLVLSDGAKVSAGASMPGLRTVYTTGREPIVIAGRTGEQYLPYIEAQISELYDVMNVQEMTSDITAQTDVFAMLFKSASQKRKYMLMVKRFSRFLREVTRVHLKLSKAYLPDDAIVSAVGKNDAVNIAEFKDSDDLCYQIKIDEESEDVETRMGRQLAMQNILQYASGQLTREDVGKLVKNMPFMNNDQSFDNFTLNDDLGTNAILALDRGKPAFISPYQDHKYMVNRLTKRMTEPDFQAINPGIQQLYEKQVATHNNIIAQQASEEQRLKDSFIPTGGYMVKIDFYTTDASGKTLKAEVPYEALAWLIDRLEKQGATQDKMSEMSMGAKVQLQQMLHQKLYPQGGPPQQGGAPGLTPPAGGLAPSAA